MILLFRTDADDDDSGDEVIVEEEYEDKEEVHACLCVCVRDALWKQSLWLILGTLLISKLLTPFVPICSQFRLYILGEST